ncbi:unnamed protein product [Vitrella brassicaformis CCMP3155]|uniref:Uncharacterized protein n=1 Tax=Vitrella brassicaformis (strain CCMP3155) TaxID=1169540 RepID=A0A0G4G2X9_VITBC|nr:unnamed protein product [Vitrella brassicaformis CCMP3155]|eukprot:CEM22396.1 unnamed protein product [Vitrella brassicaformis CCMP3155]
MADNPSAVFLSKERFSRHLQSVAAEARLTSLINNGHTLQVLTSRAISPMLENWDHLSDQVPWSQDRDGCGQHGGFVRLVVDVLVDRLHGHRTCKDPSRDVVCHRPPPADISEAHPDQVIDVTGGESESVRGVEQRVFELMQDGGYTTQKYWTTPTVESTFRRRSSSIAAHHEAFSSARLLNVLKAEAGELKTTSETRGRGLRLFTVDNSLQRRATQYHIDPHTPMSTSTVNRVISEAKNAIFPKDYFVNGLHQPGS